MVNKETKYSKAFAFNFKHLPREIESLKSFLCIFKVLLHFLPHVENGTVATWMVKIREKGETLNTGLSDEDFLGKLDTASKHEQIAFPDLLQF